MSQAGIVTSGSSNNVPVNPLQTISDFDDFLAEPSSGFFPKFGWSTVGDYNQYFGSATNPGQIFTLNAGLSSTILTTQNTNLQVANSANFRLGGGTLQINWLVDLGTLSNGVNRYNFYIGLSDADFQVPPFTLPQNGCFFQYSDNINGGNWQLVCGSGGVYTVSSTVTAATTGFVNLGIAINAAGTSVSFLYNGVSLGTIATNIPTTTSISPFIIQELILGTVPSHFIDLFYYNQVLTTARPG